MRAIKSNRTAIWQFPLNDIVRSSPSVGDIDGDGRLEVVFGSGDFFGGTDSTKVFALNIENGSPVAGWPKATNGVTNASPTLADLDGDGKLDVAIGTFGSAHGKGNGGSVYAWHGDGTAISGFPTASDGGVVLGQIVTADLRGDGGQDLIVTTGALVSAIDGATGEHLFHLAEGANVGFQNAAVVTDVEGDGILDLFAVGTVNTPAGDGRVYRWKLPTTARLGTLGWHEFRRDQHKTGSWASGLGTTTALPSSRIAGSDRFDTAAAMSRAHVTSTPASGAVYVATGRAYADALAGGPAADEAGTSVLLVNRDDVPSSTKTELARLNARDVIVLGGPGAVSDAVVSELGARRIAGNDRYATAAAISAESFKTDVPVAYVASGEAFPDALAGGVAAALGNGPILLVRSGTIPDATDAELKRLAPQRIVVLGGTAAVGRSVENQLSAYTSGGVNRLAGADRYATSVAISTSVFGTPGVRNVFLATGRNFPDALAGGPLAAASTPGAGPILLVPGNCMPSVVRAEIDRLRPQRLTLLGGSSAVTGALGALQAC
jgi:putative cell wall-binding protein